MLLQSYKQLTVACYQVGFYAEIILSITKSGQ